MCKYFTHRHRVARDGATKHLAEIPTLEKISRLGVLFYSVCSKRWSANSTAQEDLENIRLNLV